MVRNRGSPLDAYAEDAPVRQERAVWPGRVCGCEQLAVRTPRTRRASRRPAGRQEPGGGPCRASIPARDPARTVCARMSSPTRRRRSPPRAAASRTKSGESTGSGPRKHVADRRRTIGARPRASGAARATAGRSCPAPARPATLPDGKRGRPRAQQLAVGRHPLECRLLITTSVVRGRTQDDMSPDAERDAVDGRGLRDHLGATSRCPRRRRPPARLEQ